MNKEDRDKLRKILAFHPGDVVPIPGTDTVIELLDQIDGLEKKLFDVIDMTIRLSQSSMGLVDAIRNGYLFNEKNIPPR